MKRDSHDEKGSKSDCCDKDSKGDIGHCNIVSDEWISIGLNAYVEEQSRQKTFESESLCPAQ